LNVTKVFGPPGTGKTTFLLNTVNDLLNKGVPASSIGYFAFTRKAAHEAKERAYQRFQHLDFKRDLVNFRTLHSLAYARMGIQSSRIATPEHFKEFAKLAKIEISLDRGDESWEVRADNPILNVLNLARIKGADLRAEYNASRLAISWEHFLYVHRMYRKYMEEKGLYDFTDLLEMFAAADDTYYPQLEVVIIDEAQDLSPLQWKIADRLIKRANKAYVAGDDDQAIFGWAGADVTHLLAYPGEQIVLDQSYRIPRVVHEYTNKVVNRIKYRVPKTWKPREEEGSLSFYQRYTDVTLEEGSWLILAPTNYLLNGVHDYLKSLGVLFERNGVRSIGESTVEAVYAWESLRKGKAIGTQEIKALYTNLGSEHVARGFKRFIGNPEEVYDMQRLRAEGGLLAPDAPWYETLGKMSDDKRVYIRAALRRGQSLRGTPRIRLSTIHGAKGGEADHVLLLTDLSAQFTQQQEVDPDNINRLFYVGLTRTRKSLHIVYPQDIYKSFRL
jgi:DNA helicase II / ATP-dependent DNA helicase PcrA